MTSNGVLLQFSIIYWIILLHKILFRKTGSSASTERKCLGLLNL